MSTFYSPLRYPGGKNCIFSFIAEVVSENGYSGEGFAEPFAGGAGLALRLLLEGVVKEIYINDFDTSIWRFWKAVLDDTDKLCRWIEEVEVSIDSWRWAKSVRANMSPVYNFELAAATFFLNRTNVSGIMQGGPMGGPEQKGKIKIDARFNKSDLIARIKRIAERRSDIILSKYDGVEFLKKLQKNKKRILLYLDPPYVDKAANLYFCSFDTLSHIKLRDALLSTKMDWILSYDNAELVTALYYPCNQIVYTLSQCTSNRIGKEIIIYPEGVKVERAVTRLTEPSTRKFQTSEA